MTRYSTFILIISLSWPTVSFGQTDSIPQKIQLINSWTATLDTLNPFRDGDSEIIDSLNGQVAKYLLQILNDKNIVKYKIDSLLHIDNTKSPDNKVIVFSFFENTGGSYKSNVNIIYYLLPNGEPKAERMIFCTDKGEDVNNYGGSIDKILILKTKEKIKYLCFGGGIGCNTCEFNYTVLLSISDSLLYTDFCLLLDYRLGDGVLNYDEKNKTLSYEYFVYKDDTLYGAACEGERLIDKDRCKFSGKYKFNGDSFVPVKK
jgi:hypothetical protein